MFTIIAAVGKNNELGNANQLIWHLKSDLQHFKKCTMGKKVLMGRKTFDSLPNLLPGRELFVVTRKENLGNKDVKVIRRLNAFIEQYKDSEEEVFICGGAEIYKKFLPYAKKMIITEIYDTAKVADTYFPEFNHKEWHVMMEKNGIDEDKETSKSIYWQILVYTKI